MKERGKRFPNSGENIVWKGAPHAAICVYIYIMNVGKNARGKNVIGKKCQSYLLSQEFNSQPPGHESDMLATEPSRRGVVMQSYIEEYRVTGSKLLH